MYGIPKPRKIPLFQTLFRFSVKRSTLRGIVRYDLYLGVPMSGLFKLDDEPAYKAWKDQLFYTYRGLILSQNYSKLITNEFFMALSSLIQGDRWIPLWKSLNTSYPCAYHNFGHMLDVYDLVMKTHQYSYHDLLAALYHDFGYSPSSTGKDNIRNAIRAVRHDMAFLGFPESQQSEVIRKIEATENHFECRNYETPLVIADLSILNAPVHLYQEYQKAIREEYSHASDEEFRKGRLAALGSLLGNIVKCGMLTKDSCTAAREELQQLRKIQKNSDKHEGVIALYGGSFDPFHRGHLEIVKRAVEKGMFVVIAVLSNPDKKSLLAPSQRLNLTRLTLARAGLSDNTSVTDHYSSVVGALASEGCSVLLRGVRKDDPSSVNEKKTRAALLKAETGIETVLIPTSGLMSSYSSSSIKELVKLGHPAYGLPSFVRATVYRRLTSREIILVVGGIATGKTTFCKDYSRYHIIDLDVIAKKYLYTNPAFKEAPEKILRYFRSPQKYFGYMSRVRPIIMAGVIQEISTLPGSTPIMIQCNKLGLFWKELLRLCNYNIIYLEDIPQEVAEARVASRGSSKETLLAVLNLEKLAPTYEEISSFVEKRVRQAASLGLAVPDDTFETQLISRRP